MFASLICFAILLGTLPDSSTTILPIPSCYNNNSSSNSNNNNNSSSSNINNNNSSPSTSNETNSINTNMKYLHRLCKEGEPSHQVLAAGSSFVLSTRKMLTKTSEYHLIQFDPGPVPSFGLPFHRHCRHSY